MESHTSIDVLLLDTAYAVYTSVSDTWAANNNVNRIYEPCDENFKKKQRQLSPQRLL